MPKNSLLKSLNFKKPPKLELKKTKLTTFEDKLSAFKEAAIKSAANIENHLPQSLLNGQKTASIYKEFNPTINPNKITNAKELEDIDIAIVKGTFGVAENGAVLINEPQNIHRALYFIVKHLIIVLDRTKIYNNMQEAYDAIDANSFKYATFISGPSKTADIEQTLVIGAHGPKKTTIVIV